MPDEINEDLTIHEDGTSRVISDPVLFVDDENDERSTQQRTAEVEAAYGVQTFFWKDLPLQPFAISIEGDWMRHREILGDAPLGEVINLGIAMVPDALRVIWFCSHEPREWLMLPTMARGEDGEWRKLTGQERAFSLEEKIRKWADANVSRQEWPLAVSVFYQLYNSAQITRAVAKPSEHTKEASAKK